MANQDKVGMHLGPMLEFQTPELVQNTKLLKFFPYKGILLLRQNLESGCLLVFINTKHKEETIKKILDINGLCQVVWDATQTVTLFKKTLWILN